MSGRVLAAMRKLAAPPVPDRKRAIKGRSRGASALYPQRPARQIVAAGWLGIR